jgi:hypothetical protein
MDVKKHGGTKEKYMKLENALFLIEIQYIKTMTSWKYFMLRFWISSWINKLYFFYVT